MRDTDFASIISGLPVASDADVAAYEAGIARESRRERLRISGIALRDEDKRAILDDTIEDTRALRVVRRWLAAAMRTPNPDRPWLVMCGPPGTGKTFAAGWVIAREGGTYSTVESYLRNYARWLSDRKYDEREREWTMDRFRTAHLVVLDEVGMERDPELMRAAFHRLADERQSRRRQLTIAITNLNKPDFEKRLNGGVYDARTADRLARDAYVVSVDGASLRRGVPEK